MNNRMGVAMGVVSLLVVLAGAAAIRLVAKTGVRWRTATNEGPAGPVAANPQMKRLARAFVRKWTTHEEFVKNEFYPWGAQRDGTAEFEVATGGASLIETVKPIIRTKYSRH